MQSTISLPLLQLISTKNSYSLGRVYLLIRNCYSGNLHIKNLPKLAERLSIKESSLKRSLNKLIKIGWLKKQTKNWWSIISIHKLKKTQFYAPGSYRIFDSKRDNWYKNRVFDLDYTKLIAKDGSNYLKHFIFTCLLSLAHKTVSKSNKSAIGNSNKISAPRTLRKKGYQPLAASFLKSYLDLTESIPTINRRIHESAKLDLLKINRNIKVLHKCKTHGEAIDTIVYTYGSNPKLRIKRIKGKWFVFTYLSNLIKLKILN